MTDTKPHIVIIIPRGEVIRNFLYSETLKVLAQHAQITLLSVVHDTAFREMFDHYVEKIIPLEDVTRGEIRIVRYLRYSRMMAYWRFVWSEAHRSRWAEHNHRATRNLATRIRRYLSTTFWKLMANRIGLTLLARIERALSYWFRPTNEYIDLFREIKPDLVFCGSHYHGEAAYHPVQAANHLGIPAATFVFSWDNLTTQGPTIPRYQHFMVWNSKMRHQLMEIYSNLRSDQITVTGTPQFDFYFEEKFLWSKDEFCQRMGLNPNRPIVLYTTAFPSVFPAETGHLDTIISILQEYPEAIRPQVLVRVYAKDTEGTFDTHRERYTGSKDVIFPLTKWNAKWYTPLYDDLYEFTNMVRHADLGINGASTVSLELCMHDKPVINLGFDPPGSDLPFVQRWQRHLEFDHYRPVVDSGAVMVAYSVDDIRHMINLGLTQPETDSKARNQLIATMFEDKLDGQSGARVARTLLKLIGV